MKTPLALQKEDAFCYISFGVGVKGWVLAYVMYLPRGFCGRKSSLITDMPAMNQLNTQQQCQISAAPGKGGKGVLAQPEVPCMGERKWLLIMSMGTNVLWAYATSCPHRYLARGKKQ